MAKLTWSKVENKELNSFDIIIKLINDHKISGQEAYILMKDIIYKDKCETIKYVYPKDNNTDTKDYSDGDPNKYSVDIF